MILSSSDVLALKTKMDQLQVQLNRTEALLHKICNASELSEAVDLAYSYFEPNKVAENEDRPSR